MIQHVYLDVTVTIARMKHMMWCAAGEEHPAQVAGAGSAGGSLLSAGPNRARAGSSKTQSGVLAFRNCR
jgi:hypothetical protein